MAAIKALLTQVILHAQFLWASGRLPPGLSSEAAAGKVQEAMRRLYMDDPTTSPAFFGTAEACKQEFQFARDSLLEYANCADNDCRLRNQWTQTLLKASVQQLLGSSKERNRPKCLSLNASTHPVSKRFVGSSCTIRFQDTILGLCMPPSCSARDTYYAMVILCAFHQFSVRCGSETTKPFLSDSPFWTGFTWIFIFAVPIVATLIDSILLWRFQGNGACGVGPKNAVLQGLHRRDITNPAVKLALAFSFLSNGAKFLSGQPDAIRCLNGVRWLSCCWVVLHHSTLQISLPDYPRSQLQNRNITAIALLLGQMGTDAFFVLSGTVLSYSWLKTFRYANITSISYWLTFYARRYVRLTLPYALLIYIFLSTGPFCDGGWWKNLLYINNWSQNRDHWTCLAHSWYLAADFQLYLLLPLLLVPMALNWRIAYGLAGFIIILDAAIRGISYASGSLAPLSMRGIEHLGYESDFAPIQSIWEATYLRFGPYVLGLLLGHTLVKHRTNPMKHTPASKNALWMASAIVQCLLFLPYFIGHMDPWVNGLYSALMRTAFALSIAWLIYSCATGNAKRLDDFLSSRAFQPLSRLTYCVYLLHYLILLAINDSATTRTAGGNVETILLFGKCMFYTMPLAVLLHIGLEIPAVHLSSVMRWQRHTITGAYHKV